PSKCGPLRAMNSCPAVIARLSLQTLVKQASAPARRPCNGAAIRLRDRASSMCHLPCSECLRSFLKIGERVPQAVYFLVVLVALAGQQKHIPGLCGLHQVGDRLGAAALLTNLGTASAAGQDVGADTF